MLADNLMQQSRDVGGFTAAHFGYPTVLIAVRLFAERPYLRGGRMRGICGPAVRDRRVLRLLAAVLRHPLAEERVHPLHDGAL